MNLSKGDIFAGRYEVLDELGRGGFGVVYGTVDRASGARVALKLIKRGGAEAFAATQRRFEREAAALAATMHPNVVRLLDHGESDGLLYLAFEQLPGEDLRTVLKGRGRLAPLEIADILSQICAGLGPLHAQNVLHRDLKPENIRMMKTEQGRWHCKLMDFGLVVQSGSDRTRVTATGMPIGTPRYMSPEQLAAKDLTPASDVYSVGMIGYELLFGEQALLGNSWGAQLDRMRSGYNFGVPTTPEGAWLAGILARMTERDAAKRLPNATAAANLLRSTVEYPRPTNERETERRPSALPAGLILLALVLAGGGVTWLATQKDEPPLAPIVPSTRTLVSSKPASPPPADAEDVGIGEPAEKSTRPPKRSVGCDGFNGEAVPLIMLINADHEPADLLRQHSGFLDVNGGKVTVLAPEDKTHDGTLDGLRQYAIGGFRWREPADVQQIRDRIDRELQLGCIDEDRIFAVGQADGAKVALSLLCEEDPIVAAAAVHAHHLRPENWDKRGLPCKTPRPIMWLNAANSYYASPEPGAKTCSGSVKLTQKETEPIVAGINKCKPDPVEERDGPQVCRTYSCEAPLVWCDLDGGRTFPGVPVSQRGGRCEGEAGANFDAASKIWAFFEEVAANGGPENADLTEPQTDGVE